MQMNAKKKINTKRCHFKWAMATLAITWIAFSLPQIGLAQSMLSFAFNPPDGTTFIETARLKKTISQGLLQPQTQMVEAQTEYVIRRIKDGYNVTTRPIKPANLQVSAEASAIVNSMLSNMTLRYYLDGSGRLQKVYGGDEAVKKLETMLSPQLFNAFFDALGQSGKTLTQYIADAWNDRALFSLMPGNTVIADKVQTANGKIPLPIVGLVDATIQRQVSGLQACNGHRCAKVQFSYESHDEKIGQGLAEMMRRSLLNIAKALMPGHNVEEQIPIFKISNSSAAVKNIRLIDPETGLIYGEVNQMTMEGLMSLDADPETKQFNITETKEYQFQYK